MDAEEFRKRAKEAVDYAADYLKTIENKTFPSSNTKPGILMDKLPSKAPMTGDKYEDIINDIDKVFMPGKLHITSPNFHAYFPIHGSYISQIAEIFSNSFPAIPSIWDNCPSSTELEVVTVNWLAQMINLPQQFLFGPNSGGVLQASSTECILMAILSGRKKAISDVRKNQREKVLTDNDIFAKLVCYASEEAHYSVARMAEITAVKCHMVPADEKFAMRGKALSQLIDNDKKSGLIPFFCVATLGTTGLCAFDNLNEIANVCLEENLWLHIDAAYAGPAFVCPEFTPLLKGVELAHSFNVSCYKWMLVTYPCAVMWLKDTRYLHKNAASYIDNSDTCTKFPSFRHWQLASTRPCRSIKLWFVLRYFGVKGLQQHIRNHVSLAKEFEKLVTRDPDFEIVNVQMGLVAFRLKGSNLLTKKLFEYIEEDRRIILTLAESKDLFYIRFVVATLAANSDNNEFAWKVILECHSKMKTNNNIRK